MAEVLRVPKISDTVKRLKLPDCEKAGRIPKLLNSGLFG